MLCFVEHKTVGAELVGRLCTAAAQHGLHTGNELHHAEGLDKVIVRAEVKPPDAVILCALGRRHDDWDIGKLRIRAHPAQQLQPVDARKHHVEHNELRALRAQRLPKARAVLKALGLKAGGTQGVYLNIADAGVVFHAPDHNYPSLCSPVTEKMTHSAMFVA